MLLCLTKGLKQKRFRRKARNERNVELRLPQKNVKTVNRKMPLKNFK